MNAQSPQSRTPDTPTNRKWPTFIYTITNLILAQKSCNFFYSAVNNLSQELYINSLNWCSNKSLATYMYKTFTIYLTKTVAISLRLNEIQLFRYHFETNVSKISFKNVIKLALLLFELSCTKVRGMRFSVRQEKRQ